MPPVKTAMLSLQQYKKTELNRDISSWMHRLSIIGLCPNNRHLGPTENPPESEKIVSRRVV